MPAHLTEHNDDLPVPRKRYERGAIDGLGCGSCVRPLCLELTRQFCIFTMNYMISEARQRQILACAKRVFAERGFHAANISHICEAAGIGRGTLYQYFTNKQSVLTTIP